MKARSSGSARSDSTRSSLRLRPRNVLMLAFAASHGTRPKSARLALSKFRHVTKAALLGRRLRREHRVKGTGIMGLLFGWLYQRWGRVTPLVVTHTLLDTGAFLGFALLAGHVSWLPT